MNDLVSVLIPVYNAEKDIAKCVKSLLHQTYTNLEIVLVDDCSTDNSYHVLKELSDSISNVFSYKNDINRGCAATINYALAKSHGSIVAIVDNDDYVEPDYIEYLLKLMKEAEADISICGWFNDDKKYYLSDIILDSDAALEELLLDESYKSYYWNKLYKREILGNKPFLEEQKFEDLASMPFVFGKAQKVSVGKEPKYHYITGENNFSSRKKIYLNYWLSRAYYERLRFVLSNNIGGVAREFVIKKTCQNSIGAWRKLKKSNHKQEAMELYTRIKDNKKHFIKCNGISWKYKVYLMLKIL